MSGKTIRKYTGFISPEVRRPAGRAGRDFPTAVSSEPDSRVNLSCCFRRIIREVQLKKPRCHPLCALYTRELLELLIRQTQSQQDTSGHGSELVEKAIVQFYQSYQQPLQIRDHADALNVSVCWLIRCFKRYTGVTPQKYLTDIRIAKAKELLYSSTLSCGEIAASVGYPDPLYFSRVFPPRKPASRPRPSGKP